jgi:hypothetical protein
MNERIKALLLNARNMFDNGVTDSNNKIYIHGSEENLEKFAELIVRDLIDIISPYTIRMSRPGEEYLHPIQEIKKRFGVEE